MGPRLKLPPYVHGWVQDGRPRFYFRRRGYRQVKLPGLPYSPEFMSAYESALASPQCSPIGATRTAVGSVAHTVGLYYASRAFEDLAPATRAMRRALLERFRREHGDKRLAMMQPRHVADLLDRLERHAQRNMLKALRGLMAFAFSTRIIDVNPTDGYRGARVKDRGGFKTWTDDDIAAFEARHPVGSKAHIALALLRFTGQRRGDVVVLGRQHIRGGLLSLRQQKTGAQVTIPVLPELEAVLAASTISGLTFLTTEFGRPFTAAGFGGWFRRRCNEAGLRGLSAHGLRKAAATRLADHGATAHELMAWFGWSTLREAERYTRTADRERLAVRAAAKLRTSGGTK
jgi:integrase